jgi:hypothetical protein
MICAMEFIIKQMRIIFLVLIFIPVITVAQKKKVTVVGFTATECTDGAALHNAIRTRVIEKKSSRDIFEIKIGTTETCCISYTPVVKYFSNKSGLDTLYLGYGTYGEPCECVCYYELTYQIKGLKDSDFDIRFKGKPIEFSEEKYKTYPVRYKLMGNDTINFVDKYGLRQGVWTYDSGFIKTYFIFEDGVPMKEVHLYSTGKIKSESRREYSNWNYYIEYFENGQKKMECYNDRPGGSYKFDNGKCREWDINGEIIYEGPYKKPNKP